MHVIEFLREFFLTVDVKGHISPLANPIVGIAVDSSGESQPGLSKLGFRKGVIWTAAGRAVVLALGRKAAGGAEIRRNYNKMRPVRVLNVTRA